MAGRDISDMSFDEFFLGKKPGSKKRSESEEPRQEEAPKAEERPESAVDDSGFRRGRPKINVLGTFISLCVPMNEGGRRSRYEFTVEQDGRTVDLGRLKSSPLDSDVSSLPTSFDLAEAGLSPLGAMTVSIDGKAVYEIFGHSHMMFNEDGMPITRAEDTTVVLYPRGKHLWLSDAKVASSSEVGDLMIDTVEVARGGYIRVRDRPQKVEAAAAEEKPAEKKAKKVKPACSISLPPAETVAGVAVGRDVLPLYSVAPAVTFDLKGAEPGEVTVKTATSAGEAESQLSAFGGLADAVGEVSIQVSLAGKKLASARYFVVPGFECSYAGKGGIPDDGEIRFKVAGEEHRRSVYEPGMEGPYAFGTGSVKLSWNIPAVTFDSGSGEGPFRDETVQVDDLADAVVVRVRGASKKTVFMAAGATGKKENITPDWVDETVRIDCNRIRAAVFESPVRSVSLYITVDSCPVRRFLTVENTAGAVVSYADGRITATVSGSGEHVCRVFNIDKSVDTVTLNEGENVVEVGPTAISAEVVEVRNGKEVASEAVKIRDLPFLLRDAMGDVWLHVSKDKRIPVPGWVLDGGDAGARKWHAQIVRMNPELKAVSPEKMIGAFKDFRAGKACTASEYIISLQTGGPGAPVRPSSPEGGRGPLPRPLSFYDIVK